MTKNKSLVAVLIIIAVVTAVLGFWGGMQYQKSRAANSRIGQPTNFPADSSSGRTMIGETGRSREGVDFIIGEIISLDDGTITIKTANGETKVIIYSDSTTVSRTEESSVVDLKVGEEATVIGSEDSEGLVTAQNISIGNSGSRPQGGMPSGAGPSGQIENASD